MPSSSRIWKPTLTRVLPADGPIGSFYPAGLVSPAFLNCTLRVDSTPQEYDALEDDG